MATRRKKTASKKTSKKAASRRRPGKAVAARASAGLPANWREQMRQDASEEAERIPAGTGNRIKLNRNGTFSFQGADLGESIDVVIVDHCVLKTYYDEPFDEDNPTPPTCFALKLKPDNIAPHEGSPEKQAEICADCEWNVFGSADRGKGKACKDKHRLAILHAESLDGDLALLEVPVTSGATFRKYVKGLNKAADLPSYAVLTRITMDDHADYQKLNFEMLEELSDDDVAAPFSKRKEAREMIMEPFDTTGYQESRGKGARRKKSGGKKKASKKRSKRAATRRSRMS